MLPRKGWPSRTHIYFLLFNNAGLIRWSVGLLTTLFRHIYRRVAFAPLVDQNLLPGCVLNGLILWRPRRVYLRTLFSDHFGPYPLVSPNNLTIIANYNVCAQWPFSTGQDTINHIVLLTETGYVIAMIHFYKSKLNFANIGSKLKKMSQNHSDGRYH